MTTSDWPSPSRARATKDFKVKKGGGHSTLIWARAQAGGGWFMLLADAEIPQNFTKQQPPAVFFALKSTHVVIFSLHLTIITP
jgi:hypothetical protein